MSKVEDGLDIWESAKEAARHQAEEPTKGLGGAGFLYRRYCRIVEEQRDIVGPTFGNVYVSRDEEIEWLLARLSRDRFLSPERALKAIESYSSKRQARGYVGGPYGGGHYGVSSKIGGVFDIYQRFVDSRGVERESIYRIPGALGWLHGKPLEFPKSPLGKSQKSNDGRYSLLDVSWDEEKNRWRLSPLLYDTTVLRPCLSCGICPQPFPIEIDGGGYTFDLDAVEFCSDVCEQAYNWWYDVRPGIDRPTNVPAGESILTVYLDKENFPVDAHQRRTRAMKLATPRWLSGEHKKQIHVLRDYARQLTRLTGIEMHVDHIVPIRGRNVSGLHVPWNLRVITAVENSRKSNRFSQIPNSRQ